MADLLERPRAVLPALAGRALLVVLAVAALLAGAPTWVTTALSLAALAGVAARLAGRRRRGLPDTVLVGTGGALVTLVLTGLLLDLASVPLARTGWALALGALGLAGLALDALRPPTAPVPAGDRAPVRRELLRTGPWTVAALALVALALVVAVRSTDSVDTSPLQASVTRTDAQGVQVTVSSEEPTGPLELRTDSGNGATLSYPLFRLAAGGSRVTDVLLPVKGRTVITVSNPGQTQPLRTLVVDR